MTDQDQEQFRLGGTLKSSRCQSSESRDIPGRLFARVQRDNQALKDEANRILALRQRRARHFGNDLFGEHGWEMLLRLFTAPGGSLTLDQLASMSGASERTARRWILHMKAERLVEWDEVGAAVVLAARGQTALNAFLMESLNIDAQRF